MPRKLRLSVYRKNEFRKQRHQALTVESIPIPPAELALQSSTSNSFPVSIPHNNLSVLRVSIPQDIYLEAPVWTPVLLDRRLKIVSVLPAGIYACVHLVLVTIDSKCVFSFLLLLANLSSVT